MPRHLRCYTDDGVELVSVLGDPLSGEPPAGAYWDERFTGVCVGMGWLLAEAVPTMYTFQGEHGDARMITKTDNFMTSETCGHSEIMDATFKALEAAGFTFKR
mmetsp:Transcript_24862/g.53649  ORF Transcript_24862/g.53649 Transcript_24862/m.53649 type:complete len:103 (+) Transcript_24862:616-924(+)